MDKNYNFLFFRLVTLSMIVPLQVSPSVCRFSHPGMGIHTLQEISLLKGELFSTVVQTVRQNTTHIYGLWTLNPHPSTNHQFAVMFCLFIIVKSINVLLTEYIFIKVIKIVEIQFS